MRKKFASLVLLSVFTAGVTASSAVSASSNVDDAPVQVNDNANSGENIVSSNDSEGTNDLAENLNNNEEKSDEVKNLKDEENPTEKDNNLEEQSGENKDLAYTSKEKEPENKKVLKMAGVVGGAAVGATVLAYGAKKIWDSKNKGESKVDDDSSEVVPEPDSPQNKEVKKDDPGSGEENSDGGFAAWYKNNLGLSIPLTVIAAYIIWIIIRMIWLEIREIKYSKRKKLDRTKISGYVRIKPLGGLCGDIRKYPFLGNCKDGANVVGLKRVGINCLAAATFAKIEAWKPN